MAHLQPMVIHAGTGVHGSATVVVVVEKGLEMEEGLDSEVLRRRSHIPICIRFRSSDHGQDSIVSKAREAEKLSRNTGRVYRRRAGPWSNLSF